MCQVMGLCAAARPLSVCISQQWSFVLSVPDIAKYRYIKRAKDGLVFSEEYRVTSMLVGR